MPGARGMVVRHTFVSRFTAEAYTPMTLKALTLGSAVIDIIVTIDPERIEQMQMRNADTSFLLVEEGRKVDAESITRHIGGGGVNTAVSLARLGFDTAPRWSRPATTATAKT
jgi:hypothetical protein